jgi:hypothetical protein
VTWAKYRAGFSDECASAGLTDTACRVHREAIDWLYLVEDASCVIPKKALSRFATSRNRSRGIAQLVAVGFWKDHGDCWEVIHHAGVIRESLAAMLRERTRTREAKRAERARENTTGEPPESHQRATRESRESQRRVADLRHLQDVTRESRAGQASSVTPTTSRPSRARGEP